MDYKIVLMRDAEENLDRFITYLFFIWNILQLWHKFYFHRNPIFDEQFTEKQFADILFSLILVSMIRQDFNPSSILMLINKTLY